MIIKKGQKQIDNMKKYKLLLLSLLAIGAMSLTSCLEGPKGATGEKGEDGEKGLKGDTGSPGKDGKDGEDGKSFLNGEGAPSDTLGKDGDSYVDTSSFDYYAKENGKWVKKGNIKGDKGDQGEKGEDGEKGPTGDKGATGDTGSSGSQGGKGETGEYLYSNTIVPSTGGEIVASKISGKVNEKVTFTIVPKDGYVFYYLYVSGSYYAYNDSKITRNEDGSYQITVDMIKNGHVVYAYFEKGEEPAPSPTPTNKGDISKTEWENAFNVDGSNFTAKISEYTNSGQTEYIYKRYKGSDGKYYFYESNGLIQKDRNYNYNEHLTGQNIIKVFDKDNQAANYYIGNQDNSWTYFDNPEYIDAIVNHEFYSDQSDELENNYYSFSYICPDFSDYYDKFTYSDDDKTYTYEAKDNNNEEVIAKGYFDARGNWYGYIKVVIKFSDKKIDSIKLYSGNQTTFINFSNYGSTIVENPLTSLHEHTYSDKYSYNSWSHWKEATCSHDYDFKDNIEMSTHTYEDGAVCSVCGYDSSDTGNNIESEGWENAFKDLFAKTRYRRSSNAKITLKYGSNNKWIYQKYDFHNDITTGWYRLHYLNINDKEKYYLTKPESSANNNKFEFGCKYYKENAESETWSVLGEDQYNSDTNYEEKSWDLDYALSYLPVCPNFGDFYNKFTYNETEQSYIFTGNKDNDVITTNKICDLTNSYTVGNDGYIYNATVGYYDIEVKFDDNYLSKLTFKTTDSTIGDNKVEIDFVWDLRGKNLTIPTHEHVFETDWTFGVKQTWEDNHEKYQYGHYHKSICLDYENNNSDENGTPLKDFTAHTYNDSVCTVCNFDSRKANNAGDWERSFTYARNSYYSKSLTANVKWGSGSEEKTLVYKSLYEENVTKVMIDYDSKQWIIIGDNEKIKIYQKSNDSDNWEVILNKTKNEIDEDNYYKMQYYNYLLYRYIVVPEIYRDSFNDYKYENGSYKSGNLSYNNLSKGDNILLSFPENKNFYEARETIYYDVTVNIEAKQTIGYVLNSISLRVTDNELFGDELVTITYDYSNVTINEPSIDEGN